MKIRNLTMVIALGVLTVTNAPATDGVARRATVGEFATQVSRALGGDAMAAEMVRGAFRGMGVTAERDASMPLTASMATRLAADLGIKVTTPSNPESSMSVGQAATLATYIGRAWLSAVSTTESVEPPVQCLTSENRGACVECCKTATDEGGQYCGRFCHANVATPSPDEPQP